VGITTFYLGTQFIALNATRRPGIPQSPTDDAGARDLTKLRAHAAKYRPLYPLLLFPRPPVTDIPAADFPPQKNLARPRFSRHIGPRQGRRALLLPGRYATVSYHLSGPRRVCDNPVPGRPYRLLAIPTGATCHPWPCITQAINCWLARRNFGGERDKLKVPIAQHRLNCYTLRAADPELSNRVV
jgi:hypothetical protein